VLCIWSAAAVAVGLPAEAHFLIYGLAGSALIVLATYPNLGTVLAVLGGGLLLLPLHPAPLRTSLSVEPGLPLAYVGMAAVIHVAIRWLRESTPKGLAMGAIGIPGFILLLTPFHALIISVTPRTVDPVLHRIDTAIFGELTFASGRLLATYPWLQVPSVWSYVALAFVGSGIYALALRGQAGTVRPAELLCSWAAAGALGAVGYLLVPAAGPRFVFPEWPWQMPDASGTYATPLLPVPRNAMPSLHATWALLICWGAREAPSWVKWLLVPWLSLTLLATVAAGGHYLIDVVAALPLTWAAAWMGARLSRARFGRLNPVPQPREPAGWVPGG
jgi:membrane-associated phospholipid phosphatase